MSFSDTQKTTIPMYNMLTPISSYCCFFRHETVNPELKRGNETTDYINMKRFFFLIPRSQSSLGGVQLTSYSPCKFLSFNLK